VEVLPFIHLLGRGFDFFTRRIQRPRRTETHDRALPFAFATLYHAARIHKLSDTPSMNDEISLEINKRRMKRGMRFAVWVASVRRGRSNVRQ
jgi:hypothetical protein